MPKVVSNTTPLLSFIKLNRLDILQEIYQRIYIPEAVYKEIETGKGKYYKDISKENWIIIKKVKNKNLVEKYTEFIDIGEVEAIALSLEIKANLLLIDDRKGRTIAEKENINITGTVGILIKAKKLGIIKEIKPYIYELIEKGNFYSETFIKLILKRSGE
ncbi:DUF3368 domain-containing protein [Persephonella sp.]